MSISDSSPLQTLFKSKAETEESSKTPSLPLSTTSYDPRHFKREFYTEKELNLEFQISRSRNYTLIEHIWFYLRKYYTPNKRNCVDFTYRRLPILTWMFSYKMGYFLNDFLAGISLAVFQMPVGMSGALIAGLPIVTGLYISFVPALLYFIFGTIAQNNIASHTITALMTSHAIKKLEGIYYPDKTFYKGVTNITSFEEYSQHEMISNGLNVTKNDKFLSYDINEAKISIAIALSFYSGLAQIFLSILHSGVISKYMSNSIVGGFLAGSAFVISLGQVPRLFGLTPAHITSPFKTIVNLSCS
jgi:MFS superfamily sulfate permease-like transporter